MQLVVCVSESLTPSFWGTWNAATHSAPHITQWSLVLLGTRIWWRNTGKKETIENINKAEEYNSFDFMTEHKKTVNNWRRPLQDRNNYEFLTKLYDYRWFEDIVDCL